MLNLPDSLQGLAEFQYGVITSRQALSAGLTRDAIRARLEGGQWQRLYFGVFAAFSGQPGRSSLLWAAVLRAGAGAALSYQTAAELHGLAHKPSSLSHVTVEGNGRRASIAVIVIHRSGRISVARHPSQSPPRTRVEETVLDLTEAARTFDEALGWVSAACSGRLTTPQRVHAAMSDRAKLRFREALRLALGDIADGVHAVLEYRYKHDVERPHGLPCGSRQVRVIRGSRSEYRDVLYRKYLVAVETDGRLAHPVEARWLDVRRDNAAAADGIITLRYSWSDVTKRPCAVAAEVGAVLSGRGWPGPLRSCGPSCGLRRR